MDWQESKISNCINDGNSGCPFSNKCSGLSYWAWVGKMAYAGGRGIEFDTHTSVKAKPAYPPAMKKSDIYRPASDVVDSEMINPSITPHDQAVRWKNRSPVLSAQWIDERSQWRTNNHEQTCMPCIEATQDRGDNSRRPTRSSRS